MNALSKGAEYFISLFQAGGKTLVGQITGILPTLACLMVVVKAIIKFIGEEKLDSFAQHSSSNTFMRHYLQFRGLYLQIRCVILCQSSCRKNIKHPL